VINWAKRGENNTLLYLAIVNGIKFEVTKMPVLRARDPQWVVFRDGEMVHDIRAQKTAYLAQTQIVTYLRDQAVNEVARIALAREWAEGDPSLDSLVVKQSAKAAAARDLYAAAADVSTMVADSHIKNGSAN
jgi:hypothetical protein